MDDEFKGKVVLVTGAAGGIGRRVCDRFDACGALVYSTDTVPVERTRFVQGDISDTAFSDQWLSYALKEAGRIDVLINNAGICPRTALPDITVEEWRKVFDVNLTATFLLSQACLKQMVVQCSGAIVNLASLAGKVGGPAASAHYSASKAAIFCLTKSLARYAAPYGVRVNAVAPGVIDTEMSRSATPEQIGSFRKSIPIGRLGEVDEVVGPILFLASEQASYITGATLDVNGGLLMD